MNVRFLPLILVVGLAACASPAEESDGRNAAGEPVSSSTDAVSVSLADFMIEPSAFELDGPTVSFEVVNDGPTPHNLTVRDASDEIVMATADLAAGATETITADLEPGEYTVFCSLAGHESLGMAGSLTVAGS
jgi:plastocyanin